MRMEYEGETKEVEVVSLHFCDDMNIYGASFADLQHNLGIVSAFARATGLKLNGGKSAYLTTDSAEGVTPGRGPTMRGRWVGGCEGHFEAAGRVDGAAMTEEDEIAPKAWDEAVRTLGVWRAVSGQSSKQAEVLQAAVEEIRHRMGGKHLTVAQVRYITNAVLVPRLTYPLRDAAMTGKRGKVVSRLDTEVRKTVRQGVGAVRSLSNAVIYAKPAKADEARGIGITNIRGRLDGDLLSRLHRCLLPSPAARFWEKEAELGGAAADEARRRVKVCSLPNDVAHVMRLEYAEAKGTKGGASPWTGNGIPRAFVDRRAGLVDIRLGARGWALGRRGERKGTALWRALPGRQTRKRT